MGGGKRGKGSGVGKRGSRGWGWQGVVLQGHRGQRGYRVGIEVRAWRGEGL